MLKKRFFLESCKNITIRLPFIAGSLCRAVFRGCAEIEIFGDIFTSGPLLHLNHSSEVQSHPSSPKPMTFIPINQSPVMQPNIHSKGQNRQEFTKSLQTNQTPAAAVDTTNNPSFRCFCNLSMLSDILLEGTLRVFGARNLRASTRNGKEMVCCV